MRKFIKTSLCFLLLVALTASASFLLNVNAAETETLYIDVNFKQTDARGMLSDINAFRTDSTGGAWYWNSDDTTKTEFNTSGNTTLTELKYDYELEKVAMQRAAEISVSFSHTRPDGSTCFTAFPSGYNAKGENIAAGYTSASAAFVGWQENDDPYSGQGHRRNMLSPNFNAIGIGHAYVNGTHYWVQELGYTSNTTTKTTVTETILCTEITADSSKLTLKSTELNGFSNYYAISEGKEIAAPDVVFSYDFEDHWPSSTSIISKPPIQWTSSDSSIAYIENKMIIGKSAGEAVLKPEGTSLSINVTVNSELKITKQPTDVLAAVGTNAKFIVEASGEGLTYQWYFKRPDRDYFEKSSTTSATYSMTMQESYADRLIYCVVSDKYGHSVQTDTVSLKLLPSAIKITTQPTTTYAKLGSTAKITVAASGEGLTYQWYFKRPDHDTFEKSSITSATYSTTMKETYANRQMYCVVTDKYGNTAKTNTIYLYMAATITKQPVDTSVPVDSRLSVSVEAVGDGLTYQWYFKKPGSTTFTKSSITSATYSTTMLADYSGRQLYCIVTDKHGKTEKSNTITITTSVSSVKITTQPTTTYAKLGSTAKITVAASGEGLTYQWYYKNPGSSTFTKSSITSAVYSTTMKENYANRQMYCVVTDKYGNTAKTNTIYLYMAATITKQPVNTSAAVGSKLSVSVEAVGDGLTYQWYFKKPGSTTFTKSSITSATYSTTMLADYSGRQLYCIVTDKHGKTEKSNTITITTSVSSVKITTQPTTTYAKLGSTAKITVAASGEGLTYQWYYKNPGSSTFTKSSITSAVYSTTMKENYANRQMYCVVTDKYGNTAKTNTIYLYMAATITKQPVDTSAAVGSKLSVSVEAVGDGLTYQWYFKKPGSTTFTKSSITSATYSTKMLAEYSGRELYCIVTDKHGKTVKSDTITISAK